MEKRKWYNKDIETSLLGFGAMRLKTIDGEIDEEKGFKLFDIAYNNGVNYFDTAFPYTNKKNEKFVGKALKRYPRESFYLATKLSLFCFDTKEECQKSIDIQLENLQTDYIDFYLIHALNRNYFQKFKEWNMLEEVIKWKKAGKIRHIGFSFHDNYETFKEILDYYDWEFCQIQFNYIDKDIQQGMQGYNDLKQRNIPIVVMEPVKGGKLANFNKDFAKDFFEYSDDSLAKWALRWVGSFDGVKVILSGMNDEAQVYDNLNTFANFIPMNEKEIQLVDNVAEKIKQATKVGCTNCKYCMPCPQGINIPGNFYMYNQYAMYQDKRDTIETYKEFKNKKSNSDLCVNCRACIDKCPQGIQIPDEFEKMMKELQFLK